MTARKDSRGNPKRERPAEQASLEDLGEAEVEHEEEPPRAPEGKRIHPRRRAPLVSNKGRKKRR